MAERACDRSIHVGGLMSCCLRTIRRSDRTTEVGSSLQCAVCLAYVEVDVDGSWRWEPSLQAMRARR